MLLETAPWYGQGLSERVIGWALQDMKDDYVCSQILINTKAGRYAQGRRQANFEFHDTSPTTRAIEDFYHSCKQRLLISESIQRLEALML